MAHGKMSEEELGDVMQRMDEGEVQILVCTTIIETGIDIPNVNTLDHRGRRPASAWPSCTRSAGRVGRSQPPRLLPI